MVSFINPILPTRQQRVKCAKQRFLCTSPRTPPSQSPSLVSSTQRPHGPVPPVVFVLGGPGSGKGTQCGKLQRDYDLVQVCVGELLRKEASLETSLGKSIAEVMQRGEIVPGHVTMRLLRAELTKLVGVCKAVLIDGFPRAMDQAAEFEELISTCCFVLYFYCDEAHMVQRLLQRGKTSGRADDTEEVVHRRLRTFMEKTLPVVEHYRQRGLLREVDSGSGNPDEVYEETKKHFHDLV